MIHDETLHKWINKTISAEELEKFKQRPEYEELLQLYDRTEGIEPPTFDANEMLANILATDKKEVVEEKPDRGAIFLNLVRFAIAAALIGLVWVLFLPRNNDNNNFVEIVTTPNETQKIELPDGSNITLYGDSRISYAKKELSRKRDIQLIGKATFDIKEGTPFTVITDLGNIRVLGTIFTVNFDNQQLSVICNEGRVNVESIDKQFRELLTPKQSLVMTSTKVIKKRVDLTRFRNAELSDVIKELEQEFGVTFEVEDNTNLTYRLNGNFQYKDLEKALKTTIGTMVQIRYEIKGKKVFLREIY